MTYRIEIKYKNNFNDGREKSLLHVIEEDTGIKLDSVKIIDIYNIFGEYNPDELILLKDELFCDPVYQEGSTDFYYAKNLDYNFCIEVSYLPGVTDNVGRTAAKGISSILKRKIKSSDVRSSLLYLFSGSIDNVKKEKIAKNVLCNNLIENYTILDKNDVISGKTISYVKPVENEIKPPYFKEINLEITDEELLKISDEYILSLSLDEMHAIRDHYRDEKVQAYRKQNNLPINPTNVELEVFAQTWSEHCKHKIFSADITYKEGSNTKEIKSLFKKYIKGSTEIIKRKRDDLLSLFIDNAGIVKFNDEYAYCVKVETHNSPSALDPYGGAMTGIVGVNRDIIGTGMGAYPIFNTDIFCFGSPFTPDDDVPAGLLHPRRIFRGVHRGVKDGGNESGIPTVNGSIVFDESFLGKPLVFCGTGGLMPLKVAGRDSHKKYIKKGDVIVMCGGRIGKDGIHGATFSSAHLTESSPTSAVQIGDPITQKKMLDFLMEARDLGLYNGLTDNGAGGLSSSIGEMATFTGGAVLKLDKCPLKYSGLDPWEILLSEAQERMSLAVPADKIDKFLELSKKRDVESTVIGEFTDTGYFECKFNGEIVCMLNMDMLHEGVPRMKLEAQWIPPKEDRLQPLNIGIKESVRKLLKSPNIASKEYWIRMYDHEVGARTVGKPFSGKENDGPSDGAVLKVFQESNEGLVVTHGIVPRYAGMDAYQMAACGIDEAFRQAVILGADPDKIVGLDNFCWPDPVQSEHTPDGMYKLAQLVRACRAVYETTIAYNCPLISGKDSMKNDYRRGGKKISVLPTLLFTAVGRIDDVTKMVSHYFKRIDEKVYLLGHTESEMGMSEYYGIHKKEGGILPKVNTDNAIRLYKKISQCIEKKILSSAHDLSDGGLVVALVESAFSGNVGVNINLDAVGIKLTDEEKLFSETPSRILVSLDKKNEDEFLGIMKDQPVFYLGETSEGNRIKIASNDKIIYEDDLGELKDIWKNALVF